jgi:hypothetical protein
LVISNTASSVGRNTLAMTNGRTNMASPAMIRDTSVETL